MAVGSERVANLPAHSVPPLIHDKVNVISVPNIMADYWWGIGESARRKDPPENFVFQQPVTLLDEFCQESSVDCVTTIFTDPQGESHNLVFVKSGPFDDFLSFTSPEDDLSQLEDSAGGSVYRLVSLEEEPDFYQNAFLASGVSSLSEDRRVQHGVHEVTSGEFEPEGVYKIYEQIDQKTVVNREDRETSENDDNIIISIFAALLLLVALSWPKRKQ